MKVIMILIIMSFFSCKIENSSIKKGDKKFESNLDAKFYFIQDSSMYKKFGFIYTYKKGLPFAKILLTNKSKFDQEIIYWPYDKEHDIKFICDNLGNKYYFKSKLVSRDVAFDPRCQYKLILKPNEFEIFYKRISFGKNYDRGENIEIDSVAIKLMGSDTLNQIYCSKLNIMNY